MQYSLLSVGIYSTKERENNCWQEQNHSISFLLDTNQKIVLLCQKKASYTGPVDFKDTLGITLTIEQGLEKISVVFHFLISIFHGINSPLTDFTIIYGAEHVWEYGRTLLC